MGLDWIPVWVEEGIRNGIALSFSFLSGFMRESSTVRIDDANGWFGGEYSLISTMAMWVMMPLIIVAIIHAVAKGSMSQLIKSALVFPAIAFGGTIVATEIIRLLIQIVDDFCGLFLNSLGSQVDTFSQRMVNAFTVVPGQGTAQFLTHVFVGVALLFAMCMTIFMLVIRDASIYLAAVFLPIGFALLVWPATAKYLRTTVEFILAMIFSKLIMVAALALAVAALTSATEPGTVGGVVLGVNDEPVTAAAGATPATAGAAAPGAGQPEGDPARTFFDGLVGLVLFGFMALAPQAASQMLGGMGLGGDAAAAFRGMSNRPGLIRQIAALERFRGIYGQVFDKKGGLLANLRQAKANRNNRGSGPNLNATLLRERGIFANEDATNDAERYGVTNEQLEFLRLRGRAEDNDRADTIKRLTESGDPNQINLGYELLRLEAEGGRVSLQMGGPRDIGNIITVEKTDSTGRRVVESQMLLDIADKSTGLGIDGVSMNLADQAVQTMVNMQERDEANRLAAGEAPSRYHVHVSTPLIDGNRRHEANGEALHARRNNWKATHGAASSTRRTFSVSAPRSAGVAGPRVPRADPFN